MISDDEPKRPRRDFLVTAALTTAGAGAALALWPFFSAMGPAADVKARRVVFDTAEVVGRRRVTIDVYNAPVLIFRRTSEELAALRDHPSVPDPRFDHGQPYPSVQPSEADNWHRSLRPEIMVCNSYCTRDPCLVLRPSELQGNLRDETYYAFGDLQCPCCGSWYDLAGRPYSGPARANLRVPPHRYISATEIEFGEEAGPAWKFSERAPANPPRWSRT